MLVSEFRLLMENLPGYLNLQKVYLPENRMILVESPPFKNKLIHWEGKYMFCNQN